MVYRYGRRLQHESIRGIKRLRPNRSNPLIESSEKYSKNTAHPIAADTGVLFTLWRKSGFRFRDSVSIQI